MNMGTGVGPGAEIRSVVIISAGVSEPSSSALLADRLAGKTLEYLGTRGVEAHVSSIELRSLALDIAKSGVAGFVVDGLRPAIERLAAADAVIAATPVYKAGVSGLFKSFIDVLDDDLLIAKPVAVTATAGSARHALIPDEQMRSLFAYMRALVIPTALFAAPEDWGAPALGGRIERAAIELGALVASGVGGSIAAETWTRHDHTFGNAAARRRVRDASAVDDAQGSADGAGTAGAGTVKAVDGVGAIDFDTELMRLATGGLGGGARGQRGGDGETGAGGRG